MDHLAAFQSTYGRHMVLCAQALDEGYHPSAVYLASIGENIAQDHRLVAINEHSKRLNKVMGAAHKAGLTNADELLHAAKVTRDTVQGEWHVIVPTHYAQPAPPT